VLVAASALALLGACSKQAEKTEDIRPVRAISLVRVGGKIVSRKVDVGTLVKKGQVLMQLDPQDLQLSQAQALANLRAAETNRDLAKAELQRYQELRSKSFVSQAVLDAKESTYNRRKPMSMRPRPAIAASPTRPAMRAAGGCGWRGDGRRCRSRPGGGGRHAGGARGQVGRKGNRHRHSGRQGG
jgi:multidrug resistance efflux pump